MKMGVVLSAAVLGAAALAVAAMPLQDAKPKGKPDEKPAAAGGMDQAMMEAWSKAGALGEQHTAFARMTGNWNLAVKIYQGPGMPPMESKSTAVRETILGGRYLVEKVKGDMGPFGPFEGHGILGYNNLTRQYDHIWMDSMSTGMMLSHGTAGADGAITMTGDYDDAMAGGAKTKTRTVTKTISDNEQTFEMYESRGGGPEAKTMEIKYTRA